MTNKVMWKGSAQGRKYTIGKDTIPAGDFLSRESDNNEETSRDDRDHFFSVDCQLTMKSAEVTKPHRTGHAIMWKLTGEKYWKCARVILVTFFLIQHKG